MSNINVKMWVAMDLSDKENEFCQIDELGVKVNSGKVKNTPNDAELFFRSFSKEIDLTVVIEAGTCSSWIARIIEHCGHKVIVANPRKVRAIWDTVNKTDERDAELLARLGRVDPILLSPIKHRCLEEQLDLTVIRLRESLVQARTKISNCIKGMLKTTGVMLEKSIEPQYLPKQLPLHISSDMLKMFEPMLIAISAMNEQIRTYEKKIDDLCLKYPECGQFMKVRGIGPITALTFRLTISDPNRLIRTRDVGAYLGLIPKRDQSGTIDKRLGITKAGDKLCRTMLIRAANYMIGSFGEDCDLRRFGLKIKAKGGKAPTKRASCAVARKLAVMMLSMWKSGEDYKQFRFSDEESIAS